MSADLREEVVFRTPEPKDGQAVWEMVSNDRQLDTNSPYYYTMWFRDFAHESLVATVRDEIVGFLTGYRRPDEPETYVVWQEAVRPRHGIPNLGVDIFEHAAAQQIADGAKYVEATVSANNKPIIWVLKKFAKAHAAEVETGVLFPSDYFPGEHHDEVLYRIGPIAS
ncbi:diaminobutyrate acetyltransferase [Saccharopolyspora erythraea]|uniref:diaminobutyrate acetyltransferase n=1 Tax=Saccharopolyspora erythraea TaxID=1836 RepID=UPI001BACFE52|nr:diaminobutyrate acetyltransferase [Saccharopolyspora erythraea]QUH05534.1 diaminobutyrate acetyltransferase [Saccharopolyspora erythraea]